MNVRKIVRRTLLGLAIVVVLAAGAFVWMMGPRNVIGMLRYDQRKEGNLHVGDRAPDVSLVALDGRTAFPIDPSNSQQPLIIVFGSYT